MESHSWRVSIWGLATELMRTTPEIDPAAGLWRSLPLAVRESGYRVAATAMLASTPLGRFYSLPTIRLAIAQDEIMADLRPMLAGWDFTADAAPAFQAWQTQQPALATRAQKLLESRWPELASPSDDVDAVRRTLRLEAYRKIAAAIGGRENFRPTPEFCRDAYLPIALPGGYETKIGRVRDTTYSHSPEDQETAALIWGDETTVSEVEHKLFPNFPASSDRDLQREALALWRSMAKLREFQYASIHPLFGELTVWASCDVPLCYQMRLSEQELRQAKVSLVDVVRLGISPYLSQVMSEYFEGHPQLVAEQLADSDIEIRHLARLLLRSAEAGAKAEN